MRNPYQLINVIIGGAQEQLSLNKFTSEVQNEVEKYVDRGEEVDEMVIAQTVCQKLNTQGVKTKHLTKNSKALEGPSPTAKLLADLSSMADVRRKLGNDVKLKRRRHGRRLKTRVHYDRPSVEREDITPRYVSSSERRRGSSSYAHLRPSRPKPEFHRSSYGVGPRYTGMSHTYRMKGYSGALSHVEPSREKFSTVELSVSLDQIERLVKKEISRLK
ncbi:unnamed protein product [Mytilus coruscus]|uniref:Uncharacterized protein n=1 Tax=Mytilus coruscus TaxID=42192 RepID=A0A6J8E5G8_MYTCO|nr:unnamed protein product [Mytilus coruscus]